jgi:hypothetical protein
MPQHVHELNYRGDHLLAGPAVAAAVAAAWGLLLLLLLAALVVAAAAVAAADLQSAKKDIGRDAMSLT